MSAPLVDVIAGAIANARGMRRGVPIITNVLDLMPDKLREEVRDDAANVLSELRAAGLDLTEYQRLRDLMGREARAHAEERERLRAERDEALALLSLYVEHYSDVAFHVRVDDGLGRKIKCPQDDTCECPLPARINAALAPRPAAVVEVRR